MIDQGRILPYSKILDQVGWLGGDKHSSLLRTLINYGHKIGYLIQKLEKNFFLTHEVTNKLKCLSQCLRVRQGAYHIASAALRSALALLENIRLCQKSLPGTNTSLLLSYTEKRFYNIGHLKLRKILPMPTYRFGQFCLKYLQNLFKAVSRKKGQNNNSHVSYPTLAGMALNFYLFNNI